MIRVVRYFDGIKHNTYTVGVDGVKMILAKEGELRIYISSKVIKRIKSSFIEITEVI